MASEPAPSRVILTYADLCGMPDDGRRYELFEGEVYVTPAPRIVHQRISRNLELVLHSYVEQHGLGEVLYAPVDVILTDTTVVQPDLLYVSRPRLPIVREHGIVAAPDLVVEILSPSSSSRDRGIKRRLYERQGVAEYWIVDAEARAVDVWRFGSDPCHERFVDRLPVRLGQATHGEIDLEATFAEG